MHISVKMEKRKHGIQLNTIISQDQSQQTIGCFVGKLFVAGNHDHPYLRSMPARLGAGEIDRRHDVPPCIGS
jgi:hypothetical protein